MGMHYLIQGIFVGMGLLVILAAAFNWDWFFTAQNARLIVGNIGRTRARLFYAVLGILMIGTGVYFFLTVRGLI